ncbi:chitotriosidase-1-like isoform X2 [Argopecten irradians]|uniref:chitotriosidase-1-like isoform X2 n=1 Tax=Argopecten irradians TaxID=31199 RepID=UPI0037150519
MYVVYIYTTLDHNSPLYSRSNETGEDAYLNQDWAVNYWLTNGTPLNKLIMGIGTYGRSFTTALQGNDMGCPARGGGTAGTYTREAGFLSYYEICANIKNGWEVRRHPEHLVPYAFKGNQWVGYDDIVSVKRKTDYIKANGLGGSMVWAIDLDDFNGQFCGQGKYPLLSAIKQNLESGAIPDIPTEAPATTHAPTQAPPQTSAPTQAPTQTAAPTQAPTQTAAPTQAPTQTTVSPAPCGAAVTCPDAHFAVNPCDPQQYYVCDHGLPKTMSCPAGLVWDIILMTCILPTANGALNGGKVTTTTQPITTAPTAPTGHSTSPPPSTPAGHTCDGPSECPDGKFLADPCNPGCYYQCAFRRGYRHCCQTGLRWSVTANVCVF